MLIFLKKEHGICENNIKYFVLAWLEDVEINMDWKSLYCSRLILASDISNIISSSNGLKHFIDSLLSSLAKSNQKVNIYKITTKKIKGILLEIINLLSW